MKTAIVIAALLATTIGTAASAATITGDTTGGPTWRRTLAGAPPPPGILSSVGTAVPYQVQPFFVGTAGSYQITLTANTPFDTYLHLYQDAFNPAAQFTNVIAANDDLDGSLNSQLTLALTGTTQYLAVVGGFGNADFGAYTLAITGPGNIAFGTLTGGPAVPEPASWAMMIAGFGLVGATARRRRLGARTA